MGSLPLPSTGAITQCQRRCAVVALVCTVAFAVYGPTAIASTFGPTVLVNTEAFLIVDDSDTAANVVVKFGDTLAKTITYNRSTTRFEFNDDVYVQNSLEVDGIAQLDGATTVNNTLDTTGNITTDANLTINEDNGAADAILTFGNATLAETLQFDNAQSRFEFSDDVYVQNNVEIDGTTQLDGATTVNNTLDTTGNITTDANLTINEDNGAADAVLTFGNAIQPRTLTYSNTNARFEFSKDVRVTGGVTAEGALSGASLTVSGAAGTVLTVDGGSLVYDATNNRLGIGTAAPETRLEVSGTMSGNAIYAQRAFSGAGLSSCSNGTNDKLLWNSTTQQFSCGSDQGGGGGGISQADGDARYVNQSGDAMTGALNIRNGAGLNASGAILTNGNITLNSDNGAADAVLTFGNATLSRTLTFNNTTQRFEFNKDVRVTGGDLTIVGSASGRLIRAQNRLESSGSLIIEQNSVLQGAVQMRNQATAPSATTTGSQLYSMDKAMPMIFDNVGTDNTWNLIDPWLSNHMACLIPGTGTAPVSVGIPTNTTGTASHQAQATTNFSTSLRRIRYASATTAGASAGTRANLTMVWRGNAAGLGGFLFAARYFQSTAVAQQRHFVGLDDSTAVIGNVEPNTLLNVVYVGANAAGTTLNVCTNDNSGTATCTNLGANFPANSTTAVYDVFFYAPPNGSYIDYYVERLDSAFTAYGTITTDLPQNSVFLAPQVWVNNGTTAAAAQIELAKYCVLSDD